MTNLDSILKSRDYNKGPSSQSYESWTIKKVEPWRIDAFVLWCWRRLLRVPWTARRSNQSTLKETSPEFLWKDWCWSWNSNPLATWCEKLTHWKRPWCWDSTKAGGEGDNRGWDSWMASLDHWTWVWVSSGSWWCTGRPGVLQPMGSQSCTWLNDGTVPIWIKIKYFNWNKRNNENLGIPERVKSDIAGILSISRVLWAGSVSMVGSKRARIWREIFLLNFGEILDTSRIPSRTRWQSMAKNWGPRSQQLFLETRQPNGGFHSPHVCWIFRGKQSPQ